MVLIENMGKHPIELNWGFKYNIKGGERVSVPNNVADAMKKRFPIIKVLGDEEEIESAEKKLKEKKIA